MVNMKSLHIHFEDIFLQGKALLQKLFFSARFSSVILVPQITPLPQHAARESLTRFELDGDDRSDRPPDEAKQLEKGVSPRCQS